MSDVRRKMLAIEEADLRARGNDDGGMDSGSAYVFELECWADLDGDGTVAIGDLLLILGVFGVAVADDCAAEPMDFDDDGWVRTSDLLLWLSEFGNECE